MPTVNDGLFAAKALSSGINIMRQHTPLLFCVVLCLLVGACDNAPQTESRSRGIRFAPSADTNDIRLSARAENVGGRLTGAEWRVGRAVLERQPKWDGFSSDPPLTVQRACSLALPDVQQRFPDVQGWTVKSVTLRILLDADSPSHLYSFPDVWIYEITFKPKDLAAKERFEHKFGEHVSTQVVLLDGTIVLPRELKE